MCIRRNEIKTLTQLSEYIHKKIKRTDFKKTDFALALLAQNPASWTVPRYIEEGLKWLEKLIIPVEAPSPTLGEPTTGERDDVAPAVSEVEAWLNASEVRTQKPMCRYAPVLIKRQNAASLWSRVLVLVRRHRS